jgi:hypothetical protein
MRIPVVLSRCADCAVGTHTLGEWYMVKDHVWEQAWAGRRKSWHGKIPGQEILCIGCLEERIGRTLTRHDFTNAPINDLNDWNISERFRNRLSTDDQFTLTTTDNPFVWMAEKMIQNLPEHEQERARQSFRNNVLKGGRHG